MEQQGKEFRAHAEREGLSVGMVTRDNDRNYRRAFDEVFTKRGITMKNISFRAPNLNA
jgi:hypothetical protein